MTRNIDWDKVDQLFMAGCNVTQVAASLNITRDTLYRKCEIEKNQTLQTYHDEKRASGDSLLLAAQYHKAIKEKNPTMLIWLGKQRLHQKENLEDKVNKDIEKKFDDKMDQVLTLLGIDQSNTKQKRTEEETQQEKDSSSQSLLSDLNIEESNINNDTKS